MNGMNIRYQELWCFKQSEQTNKFKKKQILIALKIFNFNFKLKYGRVYNGFEDDCRKTIYFINKEMIEAHNKLYENGLNSYKMGIGPFSDGSDTSDGNESNKKENQTNENYNADSSGNLSDWEAYKVSSNHEIWANEPTPFLLFLTTDKIWKGLF